MKTIVTLSEAAAALGISTAEARRLVKAALLVRVTSDTVGLARSLPGIIAFYKSESGQ